MLNVSKASAQPNRNQMDNMIDMMPTNSSQMQGTAKNLLKRSY